MVNGIILAGGFSSRLGSNKMLFSINRLPLIRHVYNSIRPFVDHIFVVTGHYHNEIKEEFQSGEVTIVYNPDYEKGMFSSVLAGVRKSKETYPQANLLIIPGDCPFVQAETYRKILDGNKGIRLVNYQGKNGHPLFVSASEADILLNKNIDYNLKLFRNERDYEIIVVNDKHILIDLDTPRDFENLDKHFGGY